MTFFSLRATYAFLLILGLSAAAWAGERHCSIDWTRLNLTAAQKQQIEQVEAQWQKEYSDIEPALLEEREKLRRMLSEHECDPIEVMRTQDSIMRKDSQLKQAAMRTYLKKRQVLNENQQHNLEEMVSQQFAMRQRELNPGSEMKVVPDHIQDLLQRVRDVWPNAADRQ